MNYRSWLISGIVVFFLAVVGGALGMIWWLQDVSQNPAHMTKIHADGSFDVPGAMYAAVFMFLGCLIGIALIVVGSVKAYRASRKN
jgi:hypothetical protein